MVEFLDTEGLAFPEPILKLAARSVDMKKGEVLEVTASYETFPKDLKLWCDRSGSQIIWIKEEGRKFRARIQF